MKEKETQRTDDKRAKHKPGQGKQHFKPEFKKSNNGRVPLKTDKCNDITWYMSDATLLKAASMLNWNAPLGSWRLNSFDDVYALTTDVTSDISYQGNIIPGIMALTMHTLPGISTDMNSPVNVAARNVFNFMRRTLSTNITGVEAADVMVYLLCMDSLYSYHAYLTRAYGIISQYAVTNKYLGRILCESLHLDYDNLVAHSSELHYYIEMFRSKVNGAFCVPDTYGFMKRHYWLYSNVFSDSSVEKGQLYVLRPYDFYQWDPTKYDTGSAAVSKGFTPRESITVSHLINFGNMLLNALITDEDVANISGLLLRAYGSDKSFQLASIPNDYAVRPTYDEYVLGQIHNADVLCPGYEVTEFPYQGTGYEIAAFDVHQVSTVNDGSYLVNDDLVQSGPYNDFVGAHFQVCEDTQYMDSFTQNPTDEEIMENSRMKVAVTMNGSYFCNTTGSFNYSLRHSGTARIQSAGLDFPLFVQMYFMDEHGDLFATDPIFGSTIVLQDNGSAAPAVTNEIVSKVGLASAISKFDWAPRFSMITWWYDVSLDPSASKASDDKDEGAKDGEKAMSHACRMGVVGDFWDYNNPAKISKYNINILHETALIGAFNVSMEGNGWKG